MDGAMMTLKCTLICVITGTLWGLTLGLGRLASAPHGPWKYILHYGIQWPVRRYFGIAVAKGNNELRSKINAGLQKIIADGTYAKIYATWFDSNVPALPAQ
ncbi:hypothetical protein CRX72_20625 [Pantoea sp. BRM17]|nr:hypothetical protein CRX72_20625 [Pantoea sp. BRM17]